MHVPYRSPCRILNKDLNLDTGSSKGKGTKPKGSTGSKKPKNKGKPEVSKKKPGSKKGKGKPNAPKHPAPEETKGPESSSKRPRKGA